MVCPTQEPYLRTQVSRFAHVRWTYTSDSLSYDTESPRVGGGWKCVVSFFHGFFFLSLGLTKFTALSHYKSANSAPLLSPSSLPLQLWSLKRIPERNNKLRVSLFVQLVALHVFRESHWILLYFANIPHRPSLILSLYLHIKPLSSHCYTLSLLLFFLFPFWTTWVLYLFHSWFIEMGEEAKQVRLFISLSFGFFGAAFYFNPYWLFFICIW